MPCCPCMHRGKLCAVSVPCFLMRKTATVESQPCFANSAFPAVRAYTKIKSHLFAGKGAFFVPWGAESNNHRVVKLSGKGGRWKKKRQIERRGGVKGRKRICRNYRSSAKRLWESRGNLRSSALCCIAIKISAVNYMPSLRRLRRLLACPAKTAKIKRRTKCNAPRLMACARMRSPPFFHATSTTWFRYNDASDRKYFRNKEGRG